MVPALCGRMECGTQMRMTADLERVFTLKGEFFGSSVVDPRGCCWHAPPTGPNSFVFAYVSAQKWPHRRSAPPTGRSPPMGNPVFTTVGGGPVWVVNSCKPLQMSNESSMRRYVIIFIVKFIFKFQQFILKHRRSISIVHHKRRFSGRGDICMNYYQKGTVFQTSTDRTMVECDVTSCLLKSLSPGVSWDFTRMFLNVAENVTCYVKAPSIVWLNGSYVVTFRIRVRPARRPYSVSILPSVLDHREKHKIHFTVYSWPFI